MSLQCMNKQVTNKFKVVSVVLIESRSKPISDHRILMQYSLFQVHVHDSELFYDLLRISRISFETPISCKKVCLKYKFCILHEMVCIKISRSF